MASNRISNNLVTASCAAVLAVYTAGYARTQSAANRIAAQVAARRSVYPPRPVASTPAPASPAASPAPSSDFATPPLPKPQPLEARVDLPKPLPAAPSLAVPDAPPPVAVPEPVAAAPEPAPIAAPAPKWKDGTYTGWGYSRHGNIEASVVIESGRIASAVISQCRTRYSCSVIDALPPQVALRQSPEVDLVSGATQSADAFYGAVVEALGKAK